MNIDLIFGALRLLPTLISLFLTGITFILFGPCFKVDTTFVQALNRGALNCAILVDIVECTVSLYLEIDVYHIFPVGLIRLGCAVYLLYLCEHTSRRKCFSRGRRYAMVLMISQMSGIIFWTHHIFKQNTFMPIAETWLPYTFLGADSLAFLYASAWMFSYYHHLFNVSAVYTIWAFEILDFAATGAIIWSYVSTQSWDSTAELYFIIFVGFGCHISIFWSHLDSPAKMMLSCIVLDFTSDLPLLILTFSQEIYKGNWIMTAALVIQFLTFIRGIIWVPLNLTKPIVEFSEPEDNEYVDLDSFEKHYNEYLDQNGGSTLPRTASDVYIDELWKLQQQLKVTQDATKGYEAELNRKESAMEEHKICQSELEKQHARITKELSNLEVNLEQNQSRMEHLQQDIEDAKKLLQKSAIQKEEINRFRREVQETIQDTKLKLEDRQDEVHRLRKLLEHKEDVWRRRRQDREDSQPKPKLPPKLSSLSRVSRPPRYSNVTSEPTGLDEPLNLDFAARNSLKNDLSKALLPPTPEDHYYEDDGHYYDFHI